MGNDVGPGGYFEGEALLQRLESRDRTRPVVFVVGSGLTLPEKGKGNGVPGVDGVIDIIEREFPDHKDTIRAHVNDEKSNKYQAAFDWLLANMGADHAARVVRHVVLKARARDHLFKKLEAEAILTKIENDHRADRERICRILENDLTGWFMPRGATALGAIVAEFPEKFGRYLVTTNYDPLIAISIRRSGGRAVTTALSGDGNPHQTFIDGCHVIHVHGYWYRHDTLHTPRQLGQTRNQLRAFLRDLVRNNTIVVMGSSGWDDLLTQAIVDVTQEQNTEFDVLWACYGEPEERVKRLLEEGWRRGRVVFYPNVDCNNFLPALLAKLRGCNPAPARLSEQETLIRQGVWLVIQRTGKAATFELQSGLTHRYRKIIRGSTGFSIQPTPGEEGKWKLNDHVLELHEPRETYYFSIPTALDGVLHLCTQIPPSTTQYSPDAQVPTTLGVAAHLTGDSKRTGSSICSGQWLKISEDGGVFVVTLRGGDGELPRTLVERDAFDLSRSWSGMWNLDSAGNITFMIGNWLLKVGTQWWNEQIPGLYLAEERDDSRDRTTRFLVAHVAAG